LFDVSSFYTKITFKLSSLDFVSHNDSLLLFTTTINTFLAFISVYRKGLPRVVSAPTREFLASRLPFAARADHLKLSVARET
jgi:hypothetical protein